MCGLEPEKILVLVNGKRRYPTSLLHLYKTEVKRVRTPYILTSTGQSVVSRIRYGEITMVNSNTDPSKSNLALQANYYTYSPFRSMGSFYYIKGTLRF